MLVLTRKEGEDVVVQLPDGGVLTLRVAEIRGDRVRLGFAAPPEVKVLRSEIRQDEEPALAEKG